jgi:hypothetical protein
MNRTPHWSRAVCTFIRGVGAMVREIYMVLGAVVVLILTIAAIRDLIASLFLKR